MIANFNEIDLIMFNVSVTAPGQSSKTWVDQVLGPQIQQLQPFLCHHWCLTGPFWASTNVLLAHMGARKRPAGTGVSCASSELAPWMWQDTDVSSKPHHWSPLIKESFSCAHSEAEDLNHAGDLNHESNQDFWLLLLTWPQDVINQVSVSSFSTFKVWGDLGWWNIRRGFTSPLQPPIICDAWTCSSSFPDRSCFCLLLPIYILFFCFLSLTSCSSQEFSHY